MQVLEDFGYGESHTHMESAHTDSRRTGCQVDVTTLRARLQSESTSSLSFPLTRPGLSFDGSRCIAAAGEEVPPLSDDCEAKGVDSDNSMSVSSQVGLASHSSRRQDSRRRDTTGWTNFSKTSVNTGTGDGGVKTADDALKFGAALSSSSMKRSISLNTLVSGASMHALAVIGTINTTQALLQGSPWRQACQASDDVAGGLGGNQTSQDGKVTDQAERANVLISLVSRGVESGFADHLRSIARVEWMRGATPEDCPPGCSCNPTSSTFAEGLAVAQRAVWPLHGSPSSPSYVKSRAQQSRAPKSRRLKESSDLPNSPGRTSWCLDEEARGLQPPTNIWHPLPGEAIFKTQAAANVIGIRSGDPPTKLENCITRDAACMTLGATMDDGKRFREWELARSTEVCAFNVSRLGHIPGSTFTGHENKCFVRPTHIMSSRLAHSVLAVCMRGSEAFVADGGEKGSLSVFCLQDWVLKTRTAPLNGSIIALCLASKGERLISAVSDNSIVIWDVSLKTFELGKCHLRILCKIRCPPIGHVLSLATYESGSTPGTEKLLLGSQDANARVLDIDLGSNQLDPLHHCDNNLMEAEITGTQVSVAATDRALDDSQAMARHGLELRLCDLEAHEYAGAFNPPITAAGTSPAEYCRSLRRCRAEPVSSERDHEGLVSVCPHQPRTICLLLSFPITIPLHEAHYFFIQGLIARRSRARAYPIAGMCME